MKNISSVTLLLATSLAMPALANEQDEVETVRQPIQFHIIEDGTNKHLSVIPSNGYGKNGELKESADPNSIVHQHAALLESLRKEQKELDKQAEEAAVAEFEENTEQ